MRKVQEKNFKAFQERNKRIYVKRNMRNLKRKIVITRVAADGSV
jgi:hypothetical protein